VPRRPDDPRRPRVVWLDVLRTVALLAMAAYHVVYDIELLLPGAGPDPFGGVWGALPPLIASSFLALAGAAAVLAQTRSPSRRGRYLRRVTLLAGAALAVSLVTAIAVPDRWVRFGILHLMLVCALLTPLLVRRSSATLAGLGAALLGVGVVIDSLPGNWALLAVGAPPPGFRSVDFWPVAPWASAYLAGILLGRFIFGEGHRAGRRALLGDAPARLHRLVAALAAPGRHSLTFYLTHQPIIIAVVWVVITTSGRRPAWP